MCTFGVLGLLCEARRPQSRRGFTQQPENPYIPLSGSGASRHPERHKRAKMVVGEGKKSEILGGPAEGGPEEGGQEEGCPAEGPAQGGPNQ